jgi:hypothetical protein
MLRFIQRALILAVVAATLISGLPALAQDWANKMFNETEHDFGAVARGSKTEYEFELTNLYKEDIHIASVRSSGGPFSPVIAKPVLKTLEKGSIHCKVHTKDFFGQRSATVMVAIDKTYYAEVYLKVKCYIRTDVVFEPGAIEFGEVELGSKPEKKIAVSYAGRDDWAIKEVRCENKHLEVKLGDAVRKPGRVNYELTVRFKGDAPEGEIHDKIVLVTDDEKRNELPIVVNGRVTAAGERRE